MKIIQENPEDYEAYCMIRDSLLLNNDQNFIRSKCFSCNRYTHQISQCPLLHYMPDKEKIIKKAEFYNDQERKLFFRRAKNRFRFNNVKYSAHEIQKKIEKERKINFYDDFRESRVNESSNNLESQNFENLDLKLKEIKDLSNKSFENDEEGTILKKSRFTNKNQEKSTYHNLDVLEELESENEEKKESLELDKNPLDPINLESLTKVTHNEKKILEKNLTNIRSQEDVPLKKTYENLSKIIDNKEGVDSKDEAKKIDIVFEKMYHFQQYFPEMNYKKVIQVYEHQRIRNKLFSRTLFIISSPEIATFEIKLKEKIQNFNRYSFKTSRYKELILRAYERKKMIPKRRNLPHKTLLNIGSSPRTKSLFKSPKFQDNKKKTLEELISSLLKKKKKSIFKK